MEMPKGWKRCYGFNDEVADQYYYPAAKETCFALNLMREMAEALQSYAADSFDATSLGDYDDEGQGKLARSVLKKFSDWK